MSKKSKFISLILALMFVLTAAPPILIAPGAQVEATPAIYEFTIETQGLYEKRRDIWRSTASLEWKGSYDYEIQGRRTISSIETITKQTKSARQNRASEVKLVTALNSMNACYFCGRHSTYIPTKPTFM